MSATYGGTMLGGYPAAQLTYLRGGLGDTAQVVGASSSVVGGAATGAATSAMITGAAVGSAFPVVGTVIGAVVGGAIWYFGQSKVPGTQQGGRFSVSGHKAVMTALIKAGRYQDADRETAAWFAAGQGTPAERARFKPRGPAVLPNGKPNLSLVARHVAGGALGDPTTAGLLGGNTGLVLLGVGAAVLLVAMNAKKKRRAA